MGARWLIFELLREVPEHLPKAGAARGVGCARSCRSSTACFTAMPLLLKFAPVAIAAG